MSRDANLNRLLIWNGFSADPQRPIEVDLSGNALSELADFQNYSKSSLPETLFTMHVFT
jgi:hypothetical protein